MARFTLPQIEAKKVVSQRGGHAFGVSRSFPPFSVWPANTKGAAGGPHSVSRGGGEAMGHAEKDLKMLGKQKGAEAEAPSLNGRANLSSPF